MWFYYDSGISDNLYIEHEECYPHDYDIQRLVEMTKEEYELSLQGLNFGDKRTTGKVYYEKKVPIKISDDCGDYF